MQGFFIILTITVIVYGGYLVLSVKKGPLPPPQGKQRPKSENSQ